MREPARGWEAWWDSLQARVSYVLGVGFAIYEVVVRHGQDPAVVGLVGVLLGLPKVIRGDRDRERRRREAD